MPKINKYDGVRTDVLIRAVQDNVHNLKTKKKPPKTKAVVEALRERREMQYVLSERLKLLDRTKPEFFPIGSYIEYNKTEVFKTFHSLGRVEGHDGPHVVVRLEGEVTPIKVDPLRLKLLYIREYYI